MNKTRSYPPGSSPTECPTCRRAFRGQLGVVDFDRRVCRCGRAWNSEAAKRLRYWSCTRKLPLSLKEASANATATLAEGAPVYPYLCPFCQHYHIGKMKP